MVGKPLVEAREEEKNGTSLCSGAAVIDCKNSDSAAEEAVVVIHSTFASDADWFRPDSPFFERLGGGVGKRTVRRFVWSGKNSHRARIEAGGDLARFVNQLCSSEGFQRVWCVAHSHGGHVALYALRDKEFARKLAGIAFLGTPFLHVRRRNLERFCHTFTQVLSWLIFFPIYMPFVAVALTDIPFRFGRLAGGFQLYIGNALGALLYLRYRQRLRRYVDRRLLDFLSRKQHYIFDRLGVEEWVVEAE